MSGAILTPMPVVHLVIDVQSNLLLDISRTARLQNLPLAIRRFADAIAPKVPTMWVGYGEKNLGKAFELYAASLTEKNEEREALIRNQYQITLPYARKDEDILIKFDSSVFKKSLLANYLQQRQTHTIIFTGLYTFGCPWQSIQDSCFRGFNSVVVPKLLGESSAYNHTPWEREQGMRSQMHSWPRDKTALVTFASPNHILRTLKENPAPPKGNAGSRFKPAFKL